MLSAVTESCARMAVNSKTSRAHSDITMLARMKSDLGITLQILLLSKSIKQQIKLLECLQCKLCSVVLVPERQRHGC